MLNLVNKQQWIKRQAGLLVCSRIASQAMMSRNLYSILVHVLVIQLCSSLPLDEFYPYETQNGLHSLPRNDDGDSGEIPTTSTFPFFDKQFNSLYVNTNGVISFSRAVSQYTPGRFPLGDGRIMIAPFWADVDIRNGGSVTYDEVTNNETLKKATEDVRDAFSDFKQFTATWTFVTTWYKVPFYGSSSNENDTTNTFQAILITNGRYSFVRYNYHEIKWTSGTASGGSSSGLGGVLPECGFNAGDGKYSYSITKAGNLSVFDLPYQTNVANGKAGTWMFRIDNNKIQAAGENKTDLKPRVTCNASYMEVEIQKSLYPNINWRNYHLGDVNCRMTSMTLNNIRLRTPLNGCGTNYTEDNDMLKFWNMVKIDNRYPNPFQSVITRESSTVLTFYCKYSRRQLVSTSFSPAKETVHASEGNFGNFTFSMHMYKSSDYNNMHLPFEYPVMVSLNQPLFVEYQVTNTASHLVVYADSCFATTSVNPNSYPRYEFLKSGCVLDSTMVYNYSPSSSKQRFTIKSFRFVQANNKLVYMHCELMVCHRFSNNSRCSRGCINNVRKRREAQQYEQTSKEYGLSTGPISLKKTKASNGNQGSQGMVQGMVIGLGVLGVLLLTVCAVVVVKIIRVKFLKPRANEPTPTVNAYDGPAVDETSTA